MCGVIGLVCEKYRDDLGEIAASLLKTLEYRGYDSTGAAIQGRGTQKEDIILRKDVGAPSEMVHKLGITALGGELFCGQVRWATFGAVTRENSQPHLVDCHTLLYGAHNGNVTNCDTLKEWLLGQGHKVLSDNDGEMVVHTVEHFFAAALEELAEAKRSLAEERRRAMRRAIYEASRLLEGSYAAVIADPLTKTMWAIKKGSSLYFGFGGEGAEGALAIASSDLSSILKLTRILLPLKEGEFVEYTAGYHKLFAILPGPDAEKIREIKRDPVRSRLRAADTALNAKFSSFMEQEINFEAHTIKNVLTMFAGGSEASKVLHPYIAELFNEDNERFAAALEALLDKYQDADIKKAFHELIDLPVFQKILREIPEKLKNEGTDSTPEQLADRLVSSEQGFLADLLYMARDRDDLLAVRLLDVYLEQGEVREFLAKVHDFIEIVKHALAGNSSIYMVCCGTSYHAAKAAALFFNELSGVEICPILPGDFRAQYAHSLRDGDIFIAVSQSGETKDLIDVINSIIASGKDIRRIAVVNNVNSTLPQEKCELTIPLMCGQEIAVPATKSFINQLALFYCLAMRLGEERLKDMNPELPFARDLRARLTTEEEKLAKLPLLISETIASTESQIELAARLLYLTPSIHVLATRISAVAMEGALKIREVVLNHTQGYETSEFKHGPNTILGFNTIMGPQSVSRLLSHLGATLAALITECGKKDLSATEAAHLVQAASDSIFAHNAVPLALNAEESAIFAKTVKRSALIDELRDDYPLIFITGPDELDEALTISAINTHKIRGALTVVIAEENPALRQAATKPPMDNPAYNSVYIPLPRTNSTLQTIFSATVVMQLLALRMSSLKSHYLDRLGIKDHGVHPDVPKNVSKSITVD